jgi:excisionase family DNA binding protein
LFIGHGHDQAPPRHELELLTEAELAALLKVCRRQLYKWRIAGNIPSFKLGRAVRFQASEVLAALERHKAG